jgi:DNA-directed RNA polymerase subunit RPC12/RpoP
MKPILIEKLGNIYLTENHKEKRQSGIFLCPDCNKPFNSHIRDIENGKTSRCKSCADKRFVNMATKHGKSRKSGTLYDRWRNARQRCTNENHHEYERYGGRGITFSEEFDDFVVWENYITSLQSYTDNWRKLDLTIDRIDPDKGYEKGNLRWAEKTTQSVNQRKCKNNKSGYTGVWDIKNGKFKSIIGYQNKQKCIGHYNSIKEAVEARNKYIKDNGLPHKIQEYEDDIK